MLQPLSGAGCWRQAASWPPSSTLLIGPEVPPGSPGAYTGQHEVKALPFKPDKLRGLSERLIVCTTRITTVVQSSASTKFKSK